MTVEIPLKPNQIFLSVRFTAQRLPSRLPSWELTPTAPSLGFGKNVLLLVNAFIVFNLAHDIITHRKFQVKDFIGFAHANIIYRCNKGLDKPENRRYNITYRRIPDKL